MAIAYKQSTNVDSGSVTTANLPFVSNVTGSSLIIVMARISANGRTITVSDDKGGVYSPAFTAFSDLGGDDVAVYYSMNAAGGATTMTLAISGVAATLRWAIHEYSGIATTSALDQENHTSNLTGAAPASPNVTTTQADELLFAYLDQGSTGAATTNSITPSFNKREEIAVASALKLTTGDSIVAATGTYAATFNLDASGTRLAPGIVTFKGAAAGPALTYDQDKVHSVKQAVKRSAFFCFGELWVPRKKSGLIVPSPSRPLLVGA